jgi:hypothetical protein
MINKKLRDVMNIKMNNNDLVNYLVKNVVKTSNKNRPSNTDLTDNAINKKENLSNLYDKLFTYYFFYKSTIVKFLVVTGQ